MRVKNWFKFTVVLSVLVLLPLLIGQQPLSDAQLRQIIADWFGYPVDQIQFEELLISGISWIITVSASDPTRDFTENCVQDYHVTLPNGLTWSVSIDRYHGVIYIADCSSSIQGVTEEEMLSPSQAVAIARQYLRRYFIWGDASDWEVTKITPKVWKDPITQEERWVIEPGKTVAAINIKFEPPLQAPQLPEGVVFLNNAVYCSIWIDAVSGNFLGFNGLYTQMDFPTEPFITSEEAENIARQYLLRKRVPVEGRGDWVSMPLVPEIETMRARLVYFFIFSYPYPEESDDTYLTATVGVDAHTGEVVFIE